jgi:hypothetical protein
LKNPPFSPAAVLRGAPNAPHSDSYMQVAPRGPGPGDRTRRAMLPPAGGGQFHTLAGRVVSIQGQGSSGPSGRESGPAGRPLFPDVLIDRLDIDSESRVRHDGGSAGTWLGP